MQRGGYYGDSLDKMLIKAGGQSLDIVASNYYIAQYDNYVPQFYFEQLGYFAYPMGIIMKLLMWL